ncbi:hypothetical protein LCGC14_0964510 [marine sediment metagenome]|uniref:Uncharacterized protein n=1 Tax=marine sediment metagenome TaxID=412755 RepID=A0A0F9NDL5_9ZZZZ
MKFGSIQVMKKRNEGECDFEECDDLLEAGVPYVTITIKATAKKSGKHWYHNWRLHIKCLGMWLLTQLVSRQDRRKKAGRPKGTGLQIPPEDKKRRLALCKKRVRILKQVEACTPKSSELEELYNRFAVTVKQLDAVGGPASINHRTTLDIGATLKKLEYGRSLCNTH